MTSTEGRSSEASDPCAPFRIIHLSDLHLTRTDGVARSEPNLLRPLRGMNRSFRRLLQQPAVRRADLLLVTGDVTDRGDAASWQVFCDAVREAGLGGRVAVIPGNHDVCCLGARLPGTRSAYRAADLQRAREGLGGAMAGSEALVEGGLPVRHFPLVFRPDPRVVVFGMNSNHLGNLSLASNALGEVDYHQLLRLAGKLHKHRDVPVKVIALHHSPNIPGVDTARRRGQRALTPLERLGHQVPQWQRRAIRLLAVAHGVRLVVHGHLHMLEDRRVSGVRIIGAPASTQPSRVRSGHQEHRVLRYTVSRSGGQVRTDLLAFQVPRETLE